MQDLCSRQAGFSDYSNVSGHLTGESLSALNYSAPFSLAYGEQRTSQDVLADDLSSAF